MFFFEVPQVTPPLLLIAMRGLVWALGPSDWAFRLWPALAGVAVTPVIYFVCLRLTASRNAALIAMSMWAVNPTALRYSQEVKQYTTDALAGLLLVLVAERAIDRTREDGQEPRWRGLTVLSILAIGFSHVAVFFVAAIALRLAWHIARKSAPPGRARGWRSWFAYVGVTTTTFGVVHLAIVRPQLADWVVHYWSNYYVPISSPADSLWFLTVRTVEFFPFLFSEWSGGLLPQAPSVLLVLGIAGVGLLGATRRMPALYYMASLFGLTAIVASAGQYPYGGVRTNLFLVPFIFIAIAYGLAMLITSAREHRGFRTVLLFLVVAAFPYLQLVENENSYVKQESDYRSTVRVVAENRQPADAVGVHVAGYYAFKHYDQGVTPDVLPIGSFDDTDLAAASSDIEQLIASRGTGGQVWLVFGADRGGHRNAYRSLANRLCDEEAHWAFENAAVSRFSCNTDVSSLQALPLDR